MRTSMPGWASWKCGQPRQQPFRGQRGQRRDRQHMVVVLAQQPVGREPEVVEGGADARQIVLRLRRQRQRAVLPDEQANAELFLEPPDLMADRGLRHVQLGRGQGEAQMPGRGLEGAQSIQRGQPGGHSATPRYMSLYHAKRYKVSFVEGANSADIGCNRLATGAENVHLHPRIDDKSSWYGAFDPDRRNPPRLAASATGRAANWPNGPSATCTMSACPGATSPTRPKSRSGGLEWPPGRRRLIRGTPAVFF